MIKTSMRSQLNDQLDKYNDVGPYTDTPRNEGKKQSSTNKTLKVASKDTCSTGTTIAPEQWWSRKPCDVGRDGGWEGEGG